LAAVGSELETKRTEVVELNKQLADRLDDLGRARSDLGEMKKICHVRQFLIARILVDCLALFVSIPSGVATWVRRGGGAPGGTC